jgi:hypothetical protein
MRPETGAEQTGQSLFREGRRWTHVAAAPIEKPLLIAHARGSFACRARLANHSPMQKHDQLGQ